MSLVLGILEQDFVIFCADTRITFFDGSKETITKTFYINNNIICAIGGDAETTHSIIDGVLKDTNQEDISYDQFVDGIEKEFDKLTNVSIPDVSIMIAGQTKGNLVLHLFYLLNQEAVVVESFQYSDKSERKIFGDTALHFDSIIRHFPKRAMTKDEIINAFQLVLDEGISVDESINNIMTSVFLFKR